jgi:glycosyltransferase involved in cell wall biosynthesis
MLKVSVVIPAYNAMTYLPDTLESVFKQTFTDFEVLIIDDGSTDNIGQWVKEIIDPRVKLIVQNNQGVSAARNTGINHAQGEYIAFLDADDLWEPTKLEKQVICLEKNPEIGLVDTWVALVDEHSHPTGTVIKTNAEGNVWKQIIERPTVVCGSSPLVRRSCFTNVGLFNRDLSGSADWDMWIRVASRYLFAVIKQPLVYYRQHYNSMSTNCQKMLQDNHAVINKTFQTVPSHLQYLKTRSYGNVNLYLAWRCLDNGNCQESIYFRRQAILYYPQLLFSWEYIRQSIALTITKYFGSQAYDKVRKISRNWRNNLFSLKTQSN